MSEELGEFDFLGESDTIAAASWEGYVVVDARGYIVCWRGSKTPRLYSTDSPPQASLPDGLYLAPFRLVPEGFKAISREQRSPQFGTGYEVPDALRARIAAAAEVSMATPATQPTPVPKPVMKQSEFFENYGLRHNVLRLLEKATAPRRAGDLIPYLGDTSIKLVCMSLSALHREGKVARVARGLYTAVSISQAVENTPVESPAQSEAPALQF